MKETYEDAKMEVITFDQEDVITASPGDNGGGDWGEIDP